MTCKMMKSEPIFTVLRLNLRRTLKHSKLKFIEMGYFEETNGKASIKYFS